MEPIAVAGAGIGGLTLAAALRRHGIPVVVLEEREQLGTTGAGISLWPNALAALDDIGLGDAVRDAGGTTLSGGIRRADGHWLQRIDPARFEKALGEPLVAIHRVKLLDLLADSVDPAAVRTGSAVAGLEPGSGGVTVKLADGQTVRARALVGADGIRSAVARHLDADLPWRYAGYTAWRAVATTALGDVEPAETWGPDGEFGYVPLGKDRTYWFATQRAPEGMIADGGELDYLARRLSGWHAPIAQLLDATVPDDVLRHDIHDRAMPRRWSDGPVTLIGDAAHPMRPHLGQGGCQAIIDAVTLAELIATVDDLPAAFTKHEQLRRPVAKKCVRLSATLGKALHAPRPFGPAAKRLATLLPPAISLRQLGAIAGYAAYQRPGS